ncbi:CST complex subunit TEN1 [Jatropha curcas]|uniref:CST complex subunit TEN1 n=1 Tax=Jatropha curcas TaxID=180498 RepID=UPI001893C6A3|nr:CST complex subunit TEN1 [Jatropha curcas]
MALPAIKHGELVMLKDLQPSSPFFKQGASLRITGKIFSQGGSNSMGKGSNVAARGISDGIGRCSRVLDRIDLKGMPNPYSEFVVNIHWYCVLFQIILQARVGRNVDGIDLSLYNQSLQLLRQFQADHIKSHHQIN